MALNSFKASQWKHKLIATYGSGVIFESLKSKDMKLSAAETEKLKDCQQLVNSILDKYYTEQAAQVSLAKRELQKAIAMFPNCENGYVSLAQIYIHTDEHSLAVNELQKALRINPYNPEIWNKLWLAYYRMGKVDLANEALKKYVYLDPAALPVYWPFLEYGLPNIQDSATFDSLLKYNTELIIATARKRKIRVILQNYPSNDLFLTQSVALKNKVHFVNNRMVFEKLKLQPGYNHADYFVEDGHCSSRGYGVMAENVLQALRSMPLDPKTKNKSPM
jgi:tetratricopeptide (TPR) repeat protein